MSPSRLLAVFALLVAGCEGFDLSRLPGIARVTYTAEEMREEDEQRAKFQTDRDPEALDWLLANRLRSGQSVQEVEAVIGNEGERVANDRFLKTNSTVYRDDDETWKWGPDNRGRSLYLVFRDDRLIFDSKDHLDRPL